jgi:peptide/nickel transport system permease protein
MAALAVVVLVVVSAILAPLIAPYHPNATDLLNPLANPSSSHPLGTDQLGRDTLSRLLYGARPTLLYALEATVVTFAIGLPIGLIAGFFPGRVDRTLMQINDIGMSVPVIVLVLLVLSVFATPNQFWIAMVALGIVVSPPLIRNIRAPVLAVRKELFVDAAQVAGLSRIAIVRRHVLPRIRGAVLVQLTLTCALSVLFVVSLGFLGYGVQSPNPSWGTMTADGAQALSRNAWLLVAAGGLTGIFVLSLGLLGDAIRDASVEGWAGRPPKRRGHPGSETAASDRRPVVKTDPSQLLSVRGLSIVYERDGRDVTVVSDVNFDIASGEAVGLVGESGCGKTSVARAVIRLLRGGGQISSGAIQFDGRDVLALDKAGLRQFRGSSIGYVSQEPMVALDPTFRVGWLLQEAIRSHSSLSRREASDRAIELLERVRLPHPEQVAKLYPHELSGGMAQRVSIARALAGGPRLLIADEPTTALDVTVQSEILALLRSLQTDEGLAILLVSHDWGVVSQLCKRAIVMYAGEVVEQAVLADLLDRPAHPYTEKLLACRPGATADDAVALPAIPGAVPEPERWPSSCRFAERCPYRVDACTAAPIELEALADGHVSRCIRTHELAEREAVGARN